MAQFETVMKESVREFSVGYKGHFCGICTTEEEIEALFRRLQCIGYSYSVRSSTHRQKSSDGKTNAPRLLFQMLQGDVEIPFHGSPFTVEYTSYRQCTLGPKYYDKQDTAVPDHLADHVNPIKKRKLLLDTKKSDCPATFIVKCIRIYAGYSVQSINDRINKKEVFDSLKKRLQLPNKPESFLRYYVVASPPDYHTHNVESVKASGYLHPQLAVEIVNHVKNGTTSVRVIKLLLESFVETTFTGPDRPDHVNTSFYPTDKTIYNHVYIALAKLKKTVLDQDALQIQIDEWKKEREDDIFFRPFSNDDGKVKQLLFCYQNKWQKELLRKYGKVCLLDATYKTTKYDIPLFFLTVKANRCCLVVGFFFLQVENMSSISEALKVFKQWNTDFDPTYWVTDYSESEIGAIREVFPLSKIRLCSFHRVQAWNRWLRKTGNLTVASDSKSILGLWQHIAESSSEEEFRVNREMLSSHEVIHRNSKALPYFRNQWLSVSEMWVKAFEEKGIFANINTTNGAETMNKIVKHSFLRHNTDKTLTGVAKVLVNNFLPSLFQKYCQMNSSIKMYHKSVPSFLHGKTHEFVSHVTQRYASAEVSFRKESVSVVSPGVFIVKSAESQDVSYEVDFTVPNCTCPNFQKLKFPCKHFCAIFIFFPEWGFEKINETYRTSPLICLDDTFGFGASSSGTVQTTPVRNDIQNATRNDEANKNQNIPASSNCSSLYQEAREICKNIINLTYNCNNETIRKLVDDLKNAQRSAELSNPTDNGLPVTVASHSKM